MNSKRKWIKLLDWMINLTVLVLFLPILIYGIYGIWDSYHIYKKANPAVYETYVPSENGVSFSELQKINSDVFGWIKVDKTNINYPLVQGKDNIRYVNRDAFGEFSLTGSLFLDSGNKKDFSDKNNIIYGHAMEKRAMFGELALFQKGSYFNKHRYGEVYYEGKWHKVEFFAFVHADAYDDNLYSIYINDEEEYLRYVRMLALNFRELPFDNEKFITLSTCNSRSTNGRYLLIGIVSNKAIEKDEPKYKGVNDN